MGGVELPMASAWKQSPFVDFSYADEHYESSVHAVVLKPMEGDGVLQTAVGGVGAGFAQVVPCLIALHQGRGRSISLEQPELHLNPRQMVALGDILLHAVFGIRSQESASARTGGRFDPRGTAANVLVETHSEEAILRVMRRIREIEAQWVDSDWSQGTTIRDRIIAVYVDQSNENFSGRPALMEISSDGRWTSPWPDDFFRLASMERVR